MPRNLDLTALRAFVTVVDAGGVTKASGFLNLTQSAVSMQLKRLEEALDVALFNRAERKLNLTGAGEQMLSYARRMLELNDEVLGRLTATEYEGEISLGVPHDVVYPAIPEVLQRFSKAYPRMKVRLLSMGTITLKAAFARGDVDVILTTEEDLDRGGETLLERPMVWVGAKEGQMWRQRPLRLALEDDCIFRAPALSALDASGISWELAVEADSIRTVEATVSADLAVHAIIEGTESPYAEKIEHGGALPSLPRIQINMYRTELVRTEPLDALIGFLRQSYRAM
jgi:DNA-binding transcriptional LysR family regulator